MPRKIDVSKEIGKRYGRFTVVSKVSERTKSRNLKVLCQCDCGNIKSVQYNALRIGHTKSCGCKRKDVISEYNKKHGDSQKNSEHFYLFRTWGSIKHRCFNFKNKSYKNYGGRGITMYEPWIDDYQSFKTWILENLGERKDGESIDRINVDENYIPGNLRWANAHIQSSNKRNSIKEWDIIGQKFNRLEIISIAGVNKYNRKMVLCKCECGELREVCYSTMKSSKIKSCCSCARKQQKKNILEINKIKKKTYE